MEILLALAAAVSYGVSDFAGGVLTRRAHVFVVFLLPSGTVALSRNALGKPSKWRLSFMEGRQERAEPLDRAHDLSSLSGEVEAVARVIAQCNSARQPATQPSCSGARRRARGY